MSFILFMVLIYHRSAGMQRFFLCDCIFFEATIVPTILDMATILGMVGMVPARDFHGRWLCKLLVFNDLRARGGRACVRRWVLMVNGRGLWRPARAD
jgi:hypothetical protein